MKSSGRQKMKMELSMCLLVHSVQWFWNWVLQKNGEDHLDRSCEK